jgi:predicted nucleotidyltransferase
MSTEPFPSLLDRQTILALLSRHKPAWRERYGIVDLGLFGSVARGEASADSDIDLCVRLDPPNPFSLVHFKEEAVLHRPAGNTPGGDR